MIDLIDLISDQLIHLLLVFILFRILTHKRLVNKIDLKPQPINFLQHIVMCRLTLEHFRVNPCLEFLQFAIVGTEVD